MPQSLYLLFGNLGHISKVRHVRVVILKHLGRELYVVARLILSKGDGFPSKRLPRDCSGFNT